jgi:hypothetical protein
MRFKASDFPGFLIAVVGPPLLMLLFLQSFEVWHHRGTPLLGFMATNFAVAVGLMAMFTRFVRNWDIPVGFAFVLGAVVGMVIWLQHLGYDHTALATTLKWVGLLDFFALNLSIGWQVLTNGLLPVLDRRAAPRAPHT